MRGMEQVHDGLVDELVRLERDHVVEVRLDDLGSLLREPELDPFTSRQGPRRAGIDDLVLTLGSAVRLPDDLTVRVVLPAGAPSTVTREQAEAALHEAAADAASATWRDAMAVRSMGRRQLPVGTVIAIVSAFVAYGVGYLASQIDSVAVKALLFVFAGISITIAWVVSWMIIESSTIDWRQLGRRAHAYQLLAGASLEVVTSPS